MASRALLVFLLPLLAGCVKVVEERVGGSVEPLKLADRPDLRDRLVKMLEVDQKIRADYSALFSGGKQPEFAVSAPIAAQLDSVDRANTAELQAMIQEHGWPTRKMVGREGANAAFLMVQHADKDVAFQKRYLEFLRGEFRKGDVPGDAVAMLEDRTRVSEGKKQRYGTQMTLVDGDIKIEPIDDEANVDKRRKEMGMTTLEEYVAQLRKYFGLEKK
jgi:hypothetical protein